MSLPVLFVCLWVVAAACTAMLPMRWQMIPGVALLIAAPVLIGWLGWAHGWWWAVLGLAGFGSMFRNPLIYFYKRARGEHPEIPREFRQ